MVVLLVCRDYSGFVLLVKLLWLVTSATSSALPCNMCATSVTIYFLFFAKASFAWQKDMRDVAYLVLECLAPADCTPLIPRRQQIMVQCCVHVQIRPSVKVDSQPWTNST